MSKKEKKGKGFIKEFKEFIMRGSVLDLAVGLIVGTAFTAIVKSLTNDILMPLIGAFAGGVDLSGLRIPLWNANVVYDGAIPALDAYGQVMYSSAIYYGRFIQSILDFLLVALVIFLTIKVINTFRNRLEERIAKQKAKHAEETEPVEEVVEAVVEEVVVPEDILLLQEIRDLLKPYKTSNDLKR